MSEHSLINENNAIDIGNKKEIKKVLIIIISLLANKKKEYGSMDMADITSKTEPLTLSKSLKGWLKFLFYGCSKQSFFKQNRRKFLTDLGRIIQLLISVIMIALFSSCK